jgi:hypothetical protein
MARPHPTVSHDGWFETCSPRLQLLPPLLAVRSTVQVQAKDLLALNPALPDQMQQRLLGRDVKQLFQPPPDAVRAAQRSEASVFPLPVGAIRVQLPDSSSRWCESRFSAEILSDRATDDSDWTWSKMRNFSPAEPA